MIHLIHAGNRELYVAQMAAMHAVRKAVFVDALGWKLQVRDGGEYDQFDDEHSLYLLAFDENDDSPTIGARMRPTEHGSLFSAAFESALFAHERNIVDGRTWEFSRGFAVGASRGNRNMPAKGDFRLAMLHAAMARGIERIIGFTDVATLPHFLESGWIVRLIGDAMPYEEGEGIAFEVEVSQRGCKRLREMFQIGIDPLLDLRPDEVGRLSVHAVERLSRAAQLRGESPDYWDAAAASAPRLDPVHA